MSWTANPEAATRETTFAIDGYDVTVTQAAQTPTLTIDAISSGTTTASVTWAALAGAASYEVQRSVDAGAFLVVATIPGTTFNDAGLTPGKTYLYQVRAIGSGGATVTLSNVDFATTVVFTDATLTPGVTSVRSLHLTEIRAAIDALRRSAGLTAAAYTHTAASSSLIRLTDLTQTRAAVNQARSALGLPSLGFTEVTAGSNIDASHFIELRNSVK